MAKDKEYHLSDVGFMSEAYDTPRERSIPRQDILEALTTLDDEMKVVIGGDRRSLTFVSYESVEGDSFIQFPAEDFIKMGMPQVLVQKYEPKEGGKSKFLQ